ncbi:MAG TPA: copper amine oxidase N-terminal domain-containing protein, partial [Syntrophomonadaceae bacterium]|nr:copper amine oxidase N-terminal domain-containing protein [Syntrophomonadaceae bacterium]
MKRKRLYLFITAVLVFALSAGAYAYASDPVKLFVNGQEIRPDVAPQIINGRTMVPVRWIAEALGAEVKWDDKSRTVSINRKGFVSDAVQAAELAENFGRSMKNVSLLAPEDIANNNIEENYGNLVSPALLTQWKNDLQNAPGRAASSPWPERIEIVSLEKRSASQYEIKGEIIEVTSVELVNGGAAAKRPVTLMVEKIEDRGLITDVKIEAYPNTAATIYKNAQYGFSFALPDSWQGYEIITDKWEGLAIGSQEVAESGPLILIRHPQWTEQVKRQDIPIMVFTTQQWEALQKETFHIGAAPMG